MILHVSFSSMFLKLSFLCFFCESIGTLCPASFMSSLYARILGMGSFSGKKSTTATTGQKHDTVSIQLPGPHDPARLQPRPQAASPEERARHGRQVREERRIWRRNETKTRKKTNRKTRKLKKKKEAWQKRLDRKRKNSQTNSMQSLLWTWYMLLWAQDHGKHRTSFCDRLPKPASQLSTFSWFAMKFASKNSQFFNVFNLFL